MPTANERLAASLTALHALQRSGRNVFRAAELSRVHRERLLKNAFLQEVLKGWLISSSPAARPGDSTPWYASFWEFCAGYCQERFGGDWHISPEQSLLLHAENTVVPTQVIISSPLAKNNKIDLLFGTSFYDLKVSKMPPEGDLTTRDGLRLFTAAAALIRVPETLFTRQPVEIGVVLASFKDASDLLRRLLEGGNSTVAGRLSGAFRRARRPEVADEILAAMRAAGYDVRELDPFEKQEKLVSIPPSMPPIAGRIQAMWAAMREHVLEAFPPPPGLPPDPERYLQQVEELYRHDAYHSLSIEGYRVSAELIERVRAGNWDPRRFEADRRDRDAVAARGYWQAFQAVKPDVAAIIGGAVAGGRVRNSHREWYRQLFQPCVAAGLIPPAALAGYRQDAVYLRTSRYVPPRWEAVRDAMPALFDMLESEPEPGVRAVLGHWLLGYIHPYPDGNGRLARFLMNAMLASGGYPWTVIRVDDRDEYLAALDRASIDMDIAPFADFIARRVRWAMEPGRLVV